MDIPVLKKAPDSPLTADTKSVEVKVAPKSAEQEKAASIVENPEPQISVDKTDEARKKIIELISDKKYQLSIKEKRSTPLLTINILPKKSKKAKKRTIKKVQSDPKQKKSASKSKNMVQAGVLVVLLIGFLIAIDAGFVDIGIKLPFDLIKVE